MRTLLEEIKGVIKKDLDINDEIYETDNLVDLGMDSMKFVHFIVQFEEKYCINFNDDNLLVEHYNTIKKFADYIMNTLTNKPTTNADLDK